MTYRVLPEFWADWGVFDEDEAIVDMEQIIWLSGEWETPVEDLMEQVEEVKAIGREKTMNNQYSAASLYDGGWRAEDRDQLISEYGLTADEADDICKELTAIKDGLEQDLAGELREMISLGWTDEEVKDDPEAFLDRIGEYKEGLTEEDIWKVWANVNAQRADP